ncbi:uncharacterized protein TRAVEDRAFT_131744, partial [Trametes versicolor FP-101664 SS1]|uniref:uncharacterized protein n=1 Tax=Trametes versicolor (strain FP-101664) TaxID=717944 RepID=UPI0004622A64
MRLFFEKWLPGAELPERRKLSGKYLNDAVVSARAKTRSIVHGQLATGVSDGWKNIAKVNVVTSMMSVKREPHLVQTHDMTGLPKTGEQHAEIIEEDIILMRREFDVHPIGWVTDDGPDGKGARNLLRKRMPWLITLVCWAHQSSLLAGDFLSFPEYKETVSEALDIVRWFNNHGSALDLFNKEQLLTYPDRTRALALILPAVTRWTTHFQCSSRLLLLARAFKLCIARNKDCLLEIGEKSQTANAKETSRRVIASIEDPSFWTRLDRVEAYLKPLAIATNILQASHTRLDHALLALANLFRIYSHGDTEKGAGKDQALFILAAFFNPYIRGYCFDRETLPPSELYELAERAFTRFYGCEPDARFAEALVEYSQAKAEFTDEKMRLKQAEQRALEKDTDIDIVSIWADIDRSNDALAVCPGRNGVAKLAIRILSVVANSAGVECAFSDFGRIHTKARNRLTTKTVHDTGTLRLAIRREHAVAGLSTRRLKRKL